MASPSTSQKYIIGIDLGESSIGWAIIRDENGPCELLRAGVRVFEAGLENLETDGKGQSRNLTRREARLARRNIWRRKRRDNKLFNLLQNAGLLPDGKVESPIDRHELLVKLDKALFDRHVGDEKKKSALSHVVPYLLRAKALDERLELHEIGRALYHLGQRRGFLSNRKAPPKKDEDEKSKVKAGIGELTGKMQDVGARTLGEYFSQLDPQEERIRQRYTHRDMYKDEFEKIWAAQARHYPDLLTEELRKEISDAIFYQRPLKVQTYLIGNCELERGRKRAPWACLPAQRFRMLQRVNDLRIITPDGELVDMTPEQRKTLIEELEIKGDLKFSNIKKLIGLTRKYHFNLEEGGEKILPGNRTNAEFAEIFGDRWKENSDFERARIADEVISFEKPEALGKRGLEAWSLGEEAAAKLAELEFEPGYCNLSRKALKKILPYLEQGEHYATARKKVYPGADKPGEVRDELPPVLSENTSLRNPIVTRALTELRKVVNAIISENGKPSIIRIELARDLRKTPKQREQSWKRMRANEKARKKAAEEIIRQAGIQQPTGRDILKYQLAEECKWRCPYTGKSIGWNALFGPSPEFDIEHILPFDRSLDDSYVNKTLCQNEENRKKGDRTPFEAYAETDKWEEIIQRVKEFKGDGGIISEKLRRFQMTSEKLNERFDQFSSRQLNDTRYASTLAAEYLGLLYGGTIDGEGRRRIQVGSGPVTNYLRWVWNLNRILSGGPQKSRENHCHHAIDAVCIALTDAGTVQRLSRAAQRTPVKGNRRFAPMDPPWEGFYDKVKASIDNLVVSHRVDRKVSGPLHEETFYSKEHDGVDKRGKPCKYRHVRKPIEKLTQADIKQGAIVDPAVRKLVEEKLNEFGGDIKKFTEQTNHPYLVTKKGDRVPIHKVRIRKSIQVETVGSGHRARHVIPGDNHHVEIVEITDKKGRKKWEGHIVTRLEAHARRERGEPVIQRVHGEGKEFRFSLCGGDIIEIDEENGNRGLYVVRTISREKGGRLVLVKISEARKMQDIPASQKPRPYIDGLRKLNCMKKTIDPLGRVNPAND